MTGSTELIAQKGTKLPNPQRSGCSCRSQLPLQSVSQSQAQGPMRPRLAPPPPRHSRHMQSHSPAAVRNQDQWATGFWGRAAMGGRPEGPDQVSPVTEMGRCIHRQQLDWSLAFTHICKNPFEDESPQLNFGNLCTSINATN